MIADDDNSYLSNYQLELFLLRKDLQDHIDEKITNVPKQPRKKRIAKPNNYWVMSDMRTSDGVVTQLGWERIETLTRFILKKHFPTISIYKDLVQIGVVKAAGVIANDPENGEYRSLRTYIYTCIRNEISNYLYHTHKRTKESSDGLLFCKTKFRRSSIDYKYVDVVFRKLSKRLAVHKSFITQLVEILSDSDEEDNNKLFYEELKLRNKEMCLNISEDCLSEAIFDLLYPIEKQLLILIVNEIKKDSI